jgi:outer membrane protein assembly factor BamB
MKDLFRLSAVAALVFLSGCSSTGSNSTVAQPDRAAGRTVAQPSDIARSAPAGRLIVGTKCGTNAPRIMTIDLPLTSSSPKKMTPLPSAAMCADGFAIAQKTLFVATPHSGVLAYALPLTRHSAPAYQLGTGAAEMGVTVGPNGRLFVSNDDTHRVEVFNPPFSGDSKRSLAFGTSVMLNESTLDFDDQFVLYVADNGHKQVLIYYQPFTDGSAPAATIAPSGAGSAVAAAVDSSGNLYVADAANDAIYVFQPPNWSNAPSYTISGSASQLNAPHGLATDDQGDLYVANGRGGELLEFAAPLTQSSVPAVVVNGLGRMVGLEVIK